MDYKTALKEIESILNRESTTWQEKKNMLADMIVGIHRDAHQSSMGDETDLGVFNLD